ncbi:hypothetical protein HNR00_000290 [Methylorubrum rhodinum]|uniref:Uncharacterized protein n=1 Tax=Methylorubrum rhodinum TaxID=29428 RepID=A0A840ZEY6_9HYPH|nr:hypothetical protein [Methylorubrum rhodinum]MBB5755601.1 hypothetical protein [Methylorubrum rhodinum]
MRASPFRILLGSLSLALSWSTAALAAPEAKVKAPRLAEAPAAPAAKPGTVWTAAEPDNCSRARRKLWQEGEGWIVKTITVCR